MKRVAFLACLALLAACGEQEDLHPFQEVKMEGNAQGTTYHITYLDSAGRDFKSEVDSILKGFDEVLSTYLESSVISEINRNDTGGNIIEPKGYLREVLDLSFTMYDITGGAFDPTVEPLLQAWGVEEGEFSEPDSIALDSLMQAVGLPKLVVYPDPEDENHLILAKPNGMTLNFNAIAQGYSVDILCDFLNDQGINNYLVELGGELRCKGVNKRNTVWTIGIDKPVDGNEHQVGEKIRVSGKAVATSGSYRKFVEAEGKRYSHVLNPKTGKPVVHNLLSATVIAEDCGTADALATSFLVMGMDEAKKSVDSQENVEAVLIYLQPDSSFATWSSQGVQFLSEK